MTRWRAVRAPPGERDELKGTLCYDQNRVFVSGTSSGASLANQLACKYAGNTDGYAVRGVATNDGVLPVQAQWRPTCTDKPLAGIWIWAFDDHAAGFPSVPGAVERAMQVNGCTADTIQAAATQDFPIGGGNANSACQLMQGCSALNPLVICKVSDNGNGSRSALANPAFANFLQRLAAP